MELILLIPYYAVVYLSWRWSMGGGMTLSEFSGISGTIWGRTVTEPASCKKIRTSAVIRLVPGILLFTAAIVFFFPVNALISDAYHLDPWAGGSRGIMWFVVLLGMMLFFLGFIALGCWSGIKISAKAAAKLHRSHFAVDVLADLPLMAALGQYISHSQKFHMYPDGFSFYDHTGYCLGSTGFRKWHLGDLSSQELKLLRLYLLQRYPEFSYQDVTRSEKNGPNTTMVYHTHTFTRK